MTKAEWADWKQQAQTKEFFFYLRMKRQEIMEAWASGRFTRDNIETTALLNADAMGRLAVVDALLEMEFGDIEDIAVQ